MAATNGGRSQSSQPGADSKQPVVGELQERVYTVQEQKRHDVTDASAEVVAASADSDRIVRIWVDPDASFGVHIARGADAKDDDDADPTPYIPPGGTWERATEEAVNAIRHKDAAANVTVDVETEVPQT